MPTKDKNASEQTNANKAESIQDVAFASALTGKPFISCGVNRRMNLGNFEHLDIYAGITVPVGSDMESMKEEISIAIADAMKVVSQETYERFSAIKQAQDEGRPST
jgi:hypothetical protein